MKGIGRVISSPSDGGAVYFMGNREPSRRAGPATKSMERKNNGFHCER